MYSWGYPTFWQTTQQYLITRELGFWEGEKESKEKGGMRGVGDRYLSAEVSRWRNDHGILDEWTTAMSHAYICRDDENIPRLVRRNGRQNAWEVYTAWEEMQHQVHTRGIQCKQQAKAYLPSEKYTEELAPAVSLILFLLLLRLFLPSMTWHYYASLIWYRLRAFFNTKDNIVYASCRVGEGRTTGPRRTIANHFDSLRVQGAYYVDSWGTRIFCQSLECSSSLTFLSLAY